MRIRVQLHLAECLELQEKNKRGGRFGLKG